MFTSEFIKKQITKIADTGVLLAPRFFAPEAVASKIAVHITDKNGVDITASCLPKGAEAHGVLFGDYLSVYTKTATDETDIGLVLTNTKDIYAIEFGWNIAQIAQNEPFMAYQLLFVSPPEPFACLSPVFFPFNHPEAASVDDGSAVSACTITDTYPYIQVQGTKPHNADATMVMKALALRCDLGCGNLPIQAMENFAVFTKGENDD